MQSEDILAGPDKLKGPFESKTWLGLGLCVDQFSGAGGCNTSVRVLTEIENV